jgi:hypothetical protein
MTDIAYLKQCCGLSQIIATNLSTTAVGVATAAPATAAPPLPRPSQPVWLL